MNTEIPKSALIGPRSNKDKNSLDYHFQTLYALKMAWQVHETSYQDWQEILDEVEQIKTFEYIPPNSPYGSLEALLDDLGIDPHIAKNERLFRTRTIRKGPGRPQPQFEEMENRVNPYYSKDLHGNGKSYILARLKRDHPATFESYLNGEFPSARQAGIAAGFVKDVKRIQVLPIPEKIAAKIKEFLTPDQIRELIRLLQDE